jgi:hypothetical protein
MRYRVTNVVDKLAIFVIGDLGIIHKEAYDGDLQWTLHIAIENVLVGLANVERTTFDVFHSVRVDARILGTIHDTHELASFLRTTRTEYAGQGDNGQC